MTRTQKKSRKRRAKEKAKNKQGRKDFRAYLDERGIMRRKFAWSLSFLPVPDTGHFVSEMIGEEFANIKNTFEEYHTNAISSMSNDLWQRVHDITSTLSTQLDSSGGIHTRKVIKLETLIVKNSLRKIRCM